MRQTSNELVHGYQWLRLVRFVGLVVVEFAACGLIVGASGHGSVARRDC